VTLGVPEADDDGGADVGAGAGTQPLNANPDAIATRASLFTQAG
jgi:hypothetical protein